MFGMGTSKVIAASLTPLRADLGIDTEFLSQHIGWLLKQGCGQVLLFGTTGEANSFSVDERRAALEGILDAGIDPERLMVGTGCCALPDTVSLTGHALANGVRDVLVLPPFYYKNVSDDGLFVYFDRLLERVGANRMQLFLYHFPQMTGVPFSHSLIERLLAVHGERIVGLKDSSGDWGHMERLVGAFLGFKVFAGTERYLLRMLQAGGAGCISATVNVTVGRAVDIVQRWELEDVSARQDDLSRIRAVLDGFPMIPTLKYLYARRHDRYQWQYMRPPHGPLSEEEAAKLDSQLKSLDFSWPV